MEIDRVGRHSRPTRSITSLQPCRDDYLMPHTFLNWAW